MFVCCAGNDPQDNDLSGTRVYPSFYGSPLYGDNYIPNIITVGNSDETDSRAEGANWGLNSIDIYAPGTCILSTIPTELCGSTISECNLPVGHYRYGYHHISGSSMSTPHVSGVAALLLSVNPNLTAAQIENCIMNGADSITITTGDGANQLVKRLNAWGAFKYLMNNYYECKYTHIGYADKTVSYFVDGDGDYFDEHTYLQKIRVVDTGEYTFTISANAPIEVKIYDKYFNEIVISQNVFENGNKIEFSCLFSLEFEDYYIKAKFIDNSSEGNVNIYIDSPLHTHSFTKWVEYSPTQHIECCECGLKGTVKANHVVKSSDNSCMLCGAAIDLVGGFGESIIQNIQKVTLNGSYILPNGIIVLVDEDVEAYFNGTLVFYDKNNLPQTQ